MKKNRLFKHFLLPLILLANEFQFDPLRFQVVGSGGGRWLLHLLHTLFSPTKLVW